MARGFFAELQHQAKVAAREKARAEREQERARMAAIRELERARKAEERAAAKAARADAAEKKRLAKAAKEAHVAAMQAEVERRNLELSQVYDDLDSLLASTLDVDDYVDLDDLRVVVDHPPFARADLESPVPPPDPILDPAEPVFSPPAAPKGLMGLLGKRKHEKAVAQAAGAHEQAVKDWQAELAKNERARKAAEDRHKELEAQRIAQLEVERTRYAEECAAREAEAVKRNREIDELKANLGYGSVDAVQEYVSIVLSNSVYPDHFPVEHEFEFDPTSAELRLRVLVPGPDKLPTTKVFKYAKSSDEITETAVSKKACKDRYSSAVHQIALRSLHEIFEADRRGLIRTISLEVGTVTIDPATGLEGYIPFVATGAERDAFMKLDLANVVPAATLDHLGAAVSKNPFELVAADVSGVRRS